MNEREFPNDVLAMRKLKGLSSPRQIRFLEGKGFLGVEAWSFEQAMAMINRIADNGWRVPSNINPQKYSPEKYIANRAQR